MMKYFKLTPVRDELRKIYILLWPKKHLTGTTISNGVKIVGLVCLVVISTILVYSNSIFNQIRGHILALDSLNFSLRMVRNSGLRGFFFENQGRFFTVASLEKQFGISDLKSELEKLAEEGFILKITLENLKPYNTDIIFYGTIRERLISEEISLGISRLLIEDQKKIGGFFIESRTADSFKEDLRTISQFYCERFRGVAPGENPKLFYAKLLPVFLELYRDNLEKLASRMHKVISRMQDAKTQDFFGYDYASYLENLILEEKEFVKEVEKYNLLHRDAIVESQKKIIVTLRNNLPEFHRIALEKGDKFVGFLLIGSWVYPNPSLDADVDLVMIFEGDRQIKSRNAIYDKLKELLFDSVSEVHCLTNIIRLDILRPDSFQIFNFPEAELFIRNFIILTNEASQFEKIRGFLKIYYPHSFTD